MVNATLFEFAEVREIFTPACLLFITSLAQEVFDKDL